MRHGVVLPREESMAERDQPRLIFGTLAGLLGMALVACGGTGAPGKCGTYTETLGTARIVSIETAPPDGNNCTSDPVQVLFNFTPTDPLQASRAASGIALTIGTGENPPRAWVVASGLTIGSDHAAVRYDQPVGPCDPVAFKLTSLDELAGLAACN
jgi:hypothetical protein